MDYWLLRIVWCFLFTIFLIRLYECVEYLQILCDTAHKYRHSAIVRYSPEVLCFIQKFVALCIPFRNAYTKSNTSFNVQRKCSAFNSPSSSLASHMAWYFSVFIFHYSRFLFSEAYTCDLWALTFVISMNSEQQKSLIEWSYTERAYRQLTYWIGLDEAKKQCEKLDFDIAPNEFSRHICSFGTMLRKHRDV